MNFIEFFQAATGNTPYDYQHRLAGGDAGTPCRSQLIHIPTGLGKTAAVTLAWLWNYSRCAQIADAAPPRPWPRRLVYCLPMRTLVEQTRESARMWLLRLALAATETGSPERAQIEAENLRHAASLESDQERERWHAHVRAPWAGDDRAIEGAFANESAHIRDDLIWLGIHSPIVLMGGEEFDGARRDWDLYPERPAILIGTQDMLLSRALNRGYGMSRYRWPMHFGLLNNDCLWVMDETQLMGVGVETSAQLDGFRHDGKMTTIGACPTWRMSVTPDDSRLATVDHPRPADGWPTETLSEAEQSSGRPHDLVTSKKHLSAAPLTLSSSTKDDYAKKLADLIVKRHQQGSLTLVVVNRVQRAREVFGALTTGAKKAKQTPPTLYAPERVALIHSRFRPVDRDRHTKLLFDKGDRIVIATHAVEAGVDVSARLLITELAPWSSLVQRIGRCNRRAEISDAEVLWIDIQPDAKGELLLPYTEAELKHARAAVAPLSDASPQTLRAVNVTEEKIIRPVIRRRDLADLFDTTPDLCGQDLDVSRYIRDGEDSDVQFYWRDVDGDKPGEEEPAPLRRELCRVSLGDAREFLKKANAWRWNPLEEKWEPASARPGAVCLVAADSGGYDDAKGWTKNPKDRPTPCPPTDASEKERYGKDPDTFCHFWQELALHTQLVVAATNSLVAALPLESSLQATLRTAALWHDIGKAHEEFQAMLRDGHASREGRVWAKSAHNDGKCHRRGFRHELASALAWLIAGPTDAPNRDLIAYLIAAHHGEIRLSIRSLPNEPVPDKAAPQGKEWLFARGIWTIESDDAGDKLPAVQLGEVTTPAVNLDLSFMKMGEGPHGPSWLARTVALRDRLGAFGLAYLETLLCAADARASSKEGADE